jgi:transposase
MQRRKFSREFKLEAVRLVKERGVAVAQAARDLDVHENVLRKWVREFAADKQEAFPGHGQMKPSSRKSSACAKKWLNSRQSAFLKNRPGSGPPARGRNGLCYGADRRVAAGSLLVA